MYSLLPESIFGTKFREPIALWEGVLWEGALGVRSFTFIEAGAELLCVMTVPTMIGAALVCGAAFAPTGNPTSRPATDLQGLI